MIDESNTAFQAFASAELAPTSFLTTWIRSEGAKDAPSHTRRALSELSVSATGSLVKDSICNYCSHSK